MPQTAQRTILKDLTIKGFRGLEHLELHDLGRVNLLVGANNTGKTSVLEAIQLLRAEGELSGLFAIMDRRGEHLIGDHASRDLDLRRLFYEHKLDAGAGFTITASREDEGKDILTASVVSQRNGGSPLKSLGIHGAQQSDHDFIGDRFVRLDWAIVDSEEDEGRLQIPINLRGALSRRFEQLGGRFDNRREGVRFVATASLMVDEVATLLDQFILTPEETHVLDALRILDPSIERIATVFGDSRGHSRQIGRGGIVLKLEDVQERIPIGSMGDGLWRILGLALGLAGCANGVLLVDEIDTGLHFTTMEDMWRMVSATAERLNVQVFATTHSSDCWRSLASVSEELGQERAFTIQRLERDKPEAVAFSEREMVIAAQREIEVR